MAKVVFKCKSCGTTLSAEEKYVGVLMRCPHCKAELTVPGVGQIRKPTSVDRETPSVSQQPSEFSQPRQRAEFPSMTIDVLRDPRERLTRGILIALAVPIWLLLFLWIITGFGIPLIFIGIFALFALLGRLFTLAYIKTFGVRVSAQQFPEIHETTLKASEKLHITPPEVYVMQNNIWNAFAAKLAGRRIIVLLSGAVDSVLLKGDMQQLMWVVGHEIGHHAAGHIGVWHGLTMLGGWLPWFALWYRRRSELTCDRIGMYTAGSASSSIKAISNMTVGAQLAERMNVEEAIRQWQQHENEFFVRYRVIYSSHPPNLFRIKRLVESAKELGFSA